ncbi:MAG: DUF3179 domain-containing protein [Pseudomonadota bacterium]
MLFRLLALLLLATPAQALDFEAAAKDILLGTRIEREAAADAIIARGGTDLIPTLVLLMRIGGSDISARRALFELTGEDIRNWREAMEYQEAHPELVPHPSYYDLKLWYWTGIDKGFEQFFDLPIDREAMDIRFEEITWGGALADGIPSLDQPTMIPVAQAEFMLADDLVFGVEINGDARAYPLRIMGWHEMMNDVVGGVPVALAYCTLCGAGILFETQTNAAKEPLIFGSSGLLYRSNKLMFDRATNSLWNQFTGVPVVGELVGSGTRLNIRPMVTTTWKDWVRQHPDTTVLSLETGHFRDYDSGVVYREYFASPDLLYPTITDEARLLQKDRVFGIRVAGGAKAWPLEAFANTPVINDAVGFSNVVLIGDAAARTVRAYDRGQFEFSLDGAAVTGPGGVWTVTEAALVGPAGEHLSRVPGHVSYWFAWDGYLGAESELYSTPDQP